MTAVRWQPTHAAPLIRHSIRRRDVRNAARLLAAQSARGNRDADHLTAALHRAGFDLRDVSRFGAWFDRRWPWVLGAVVVSVSVGWVVLTLASSAGGWR